MCLSSVIPDMLGNTVWSHALGAVMKRQARHVDQQCLQLFGDKWRQMSALPGVLVNSDAVVEDGDRNLRCL